MDLRIKNHRNRYFNFWPHIQILLTRIRIDSEERPISVLQ